MILATRHRDVVKSVVLAEPPAASLLQDIDGPLHALGQAQYADTQRRLVATASK